MTEERHCFKCSLEIVAGRQCVYVKVRHHYDVKLGRSRDSDETFHPECFANFKLLCRPDDPAGDYEVLLNRVAKRQ